MALLALMRFTATCNIQQTENANTSSTQGPGERGGLAKHPTQFLFFLDPEPPTRIRQQHCCQQQVQKANQFDQGPRISSCFKGRGRPGPSPAPHLLWL
jgi:hypothetical protein